MKKRLKSFKYAFNGLQVLFRQEYNARIHLVLALCALLAGYWLNISPGEWIALVFAIGLVIAMEVINTAIEDIADFISPGRHPKIKHIKDLAAAAVLVSAITALIVGFIIFLPKLF